MSDKTALSPAEWKFLDAILPHLEGLSDADLERAIQEVRQMLKNLKKAGHAPHEDHSRREGRDERL